MIQTTDNCVMFNCPGCGISHAVPVKSTNGSHWQWNRSLEAPTLHPSVLFTWEYADGRLRVCHSLVQDGKIHFCNDSTHPMTGKTLDLPELT